ncbi:MAG: hypothetical protein JRJ87_03965 [Deltaproteobacteria bacterium]|nr:hypothetical protein [Deltaproteobacteria bacterium]
MKIATKILALIAAMSFLVLVTGCTPGASREVDSCDECHDHATWGMKEYCVEGETTSQLYCANPCHSNLGCHVGYWCVPLLDEGTTYEACTGCIRWVCMEESYYTGMNRVWSWGEDNCVIGGDYECPTGMVCLVDDTGTTDQYFCSDECTSDSSCLGGCCDVSGYCAPYDPYCN